MLYVIIVIIIFCLVLRLVSLVRIPRLLVSLLLISLSHLIITTLLFDKIRQVQGLPNC